jgi:hypothetical protein
MILNDAASIASIISAVVVLAAFLVALAATKWAGESAVAGRESVKLSREAAVLSKEAAEIQRQSLSAAQDVADVQRKNLREAQAAGEVIKEAAEIQRRNLETALGMWSAIERSLHHQHIVVELTRYEYLLKCVTLIEVAARNKDSTMFMHARNEFSDAMDLIPTTELTRCHELMQAHVNNVPDFSTNAKNELNPIIQDLRQRLRDLLQPDPSA